MSLTNTNTINTRIQLKYDTYEHWQESTLEILPGELCVALINLGENETAGTNIMENNSRVGYKPTILIKIGDGIQVTDSETNEQRYKYFSELDYVQTKAGDVYGWAKAATAPTAVDIGIGANASQDQTTRNGNTIWSWLNTLDGKADTNTIYELEAGADENAGKIRLNYKAASSSGAFTTGSWIPVGKIITAANNSITVNDASIGVKISPEDDNLLSINNTSTKEGLYVPKTTFTTSADAGLGENDTTYNVVTGISAVSGQPNTFSTKKIEIYTKKGIDNLINPSVEFKGVSSAANLDSMTLTASKLGDSYKLNSDGSSSLLNVPLKTAKTGDLAIVCERTVHNALLDEDELEYYWEIIPSGDDGGSDTYRPIAVNDTEVIGSNTNTGYVNFVAGTGITLTPNTETETEVNGSATTDIIIGIDTTSLATTSDITSINNKFGTLGNHTVNNESVAHTVKSYVDENIASAVSSINVANLTQTTTYLIFNCGDAGGWDSYASQVQAGD